MTISDETLMAYADGELDAAARAAVESDMREDPQIETRVAAHRTLRRKVQAAYSAELSEDVPERLLTAVRGGESTRRKVVKLQDARAAMERGAARGRPGRPQGRTAGTLGARLLAGGGVGVVLWGQTGSPLMRSAGGALVARGQLAQALSTQLAAEQSRSSPVQIGVSFRAKSGDYCRAFALSGEVSPSGLACRRDGEWQVQSLIQEAGPVAGSGSRTAPSAMSTTILKAVEAQIAGQPLDQAGGRTARP